MFFSEVKDVLHLNTVSSSANLSSLSAALSISQWSSYDDHWSMETDRSMCSVSRDVKRSIVDDEINRKMRKQGEPHENGFCCDNADTVILLIKLIKNC